MKKNCHALKSASIHIQKVIAKIVDKIDFLKDDHIKQIRKEGKALVI